MTLDPVSWFATFARNNSYPWQDGLLQDESRPGRLSRTPTGLGKTFGVVSAWAFHRAVRRDAACPQRPVNCVPMRVPAVRSVVAIRGGLRRWPSSISSGPRWCSGLLLPGRGPRSNGAEVAPHSGARSILQGGSHGHRGRHSDSSLTLAEVAHHGGEKAAEDVIDRRRSGYVVVRASRWPSMHSSVAVGPIQTWSWGGHDATRG